MAVDVIKFVKNYRDAFSIHKFGENSVVSSAYEIVNTLGGQYPWPTTAEPVCVRAGGDVLDILLGLGVRSIRVEGLDENWNPVTDDIDTTGALRSAATGKLFSRVHRAYALTAGQHGGSNIGDILIENETSLQSLGLIDADAGQTQMCQYTVPLGKSAMLLSSGFSVRSNQSCDVRVRFREGADIVAAPFCPVRTSAEHFGVLGQFSVKYESLVEYPELTDIWSEARSAGGGSSSVSADLDLLVYNNE